ncbi:MAG: hypothetical protein M0R06_08915 [Sphaerochaeta sp.]|jgi:hypothetical protein|nr:hypothetical protein [Sphaerochaeta sp.]
MKPLRRLGLLVASVLILGMSGCDAMDKAQFALHAEQHNNIKVFGEVSNAYADAADDMALRKHALQGQIIKSVDSAWIVSHTNPDGTLTASPAELATMLAQHDEAVRTMAASQSSWARLTSSYRRAVQELVIVSDTIAAKDMDVQTAKENMKQTTRTVLQVIGSIGLGATTGIIIP